jgi:hypothetical protein
VRLYIGLTLYIGALIMIQLPSGFTTNLITNVNTQIANFSELILMVIGLLLALLAVGALIRFFRH